MITSNIDLLPAVDSKYPSTADNITHINELLNKNKTRHMGWFNCNPSLMCCL